MNPNLQLHPKVKWNSMFLQQFSANTKGCDYVIGDLHGMYDLLFEALEKNHFNPKHDRCFSVGDLIDRGPDSEKCLLLIDEDWFFPVRGNHEDTLRQVTRTPCYTVMADWIVNGGNWHLNVAARTMHDYADRVDQLPYIIEVERPDNTRVAICHAEYPLANWNPGKIEADPGLTKALQWSRQKVYEKDTSSVNGIDHIVCGHTIVDTPLTLGNSHFIDTGAYKSKVLTMLPLQDIGK